MSVNAAGKLSLYDQAESLIMKSTIGFIPFTGNEEGKASYPRAVTVCGSGSLVKIGDNYGIVTAGHVVAELLKHNWTGIAYFPYGGTGAQGIKIRRSLLGFASLYSNNNDEFGPDIAYVEIHVSDAARLTSICTFINLDLHSERSKEVYPEDEIFYCVGGTLSVETTTTQRPSTPIHDVNISACVEKGIIRNLSSTSYSTNSFDRFQFTPTPQPGHTSPSSYESMSGGGLWRIRKKAEKDGDAVDSHTLIGVNFYQIPSASSGLDIIDHGPVSLHTHLRGQIKSTFGY